MQIKVTNRGTAEVIKFDIPYIVISIYSTGSEPANIPYYSNCIDILPIQFDDLAEDFSFTDKEGNVNSLKAITEKQANQIWQFVEAWKSDDIDLILVHCDAGTCRSPAVAAAISRIYTGEDREWFQKPYLPNMKVYNTMLKVKGLSNDYSE